MTKVIQPNEIYKCLDLEDLPGEIWADIEGWTGYYQISNLGRGKSLERLVPFRHFNKKLPNLIFRALIDKDGYLFFKFTKNNIGKNYRINRLVGKYFVPNPNNLPEVNHLNGDKFNNCSWNFEWTTHADNVQHAYDIGLIKHKKGVDSKLTKCNQSQVDEINRMLSIGIQGTEIAKIFNIHSSTIYKIRDRTKTL